MLILHVYSTKYPNEFHTIYHTKTKYYIYLSKGDMCRFTASSGEWDGVDLALLNQVSKESS